MEGKETTLAEAWVVLEQATADYDARKREAEAAGTAATSALNKLNRAQQAVDKIFKLSRDKAPFTSDWGTARRASERIPVTNG